MTQDSLDIIVKPTRDIREFLEHRFEHTFNPLPKRRMRLHELNICDEFVVDSSFLTVSYVHSKDYGGDRAIVQISNWDDAINCSGYSMWLDTLVYKVTRREE